MSEQREKIKDLEDQVKDLQQRMTHAEIAINQLFPARVIPVHLYDKTHAWSAAPNPDEVIGQYGEWGQGGDPVWSLEPGDYQLMNTYTVETFDLGTVRWLQIRTIANDHSMTPDGFAWLYVDPRLVDAEALYRELSVGAIEPVKPDDYTQRIWDGMEAVEENTKESEKGTE